MNNYPPGCYRIPEDVVKYTRQMDHGFAEMLKIQKEEQKRKDAYGKKEANNEAPTP